MGGYHSPQWWSHSPFAITESLGRKRPVRVLGSALALALALGGARNAWAQAAPPVIVQRGVGAEECPDAPSLAARIERIRGKPERDRVGYRVTFTREENVFAAVITAPSGRMRALESRSATCSALANATAVTLALIFDSDPVVDTIPKPVPPVVVPVTAVPTPPPPEPPASNLEANLAVGVVGLAGVIAPVSLGFSAEVGIAGARWRSSIGGLWVMPKTITLGPGTVRERLLSGLVRVCYTPLRADMLRLDLCSGAFIGLTTAEAQGYSRNDRRTRPWIALPIEVAFAGGTSRVGWELVAGALIPARRNDFGIEGLGVAYQSPPIGGLLSLRVFGTVPLLW
jgi:hypothetical protein